jgi:DNA-nicking Smr family endonuclease
MSTDDRQRRKLSEEERTLWGRVTRAVAPLRRVPAAAGEAPPSRSPGKPQPAPRAHAPGRGAAAKPAPKSPPSLEPLDRTLKRRLARGHVAIDDRIDLHGRTQSQAHAALLRFLRAAQADGAKLVLVITGKGAGTERGERGVLKRQVPLWLVLPDFRAYVVGFDDAHIGHGGQGALYVRIRSRKPATGNRKRDHSDD